MKSNLNRRKEIFRDALPSIGTKEYEEIIKKFKELENQQQFKDFNKKNWQRATRSLEAQMLSTCNLITENTLRHFLVEFNTRTWKYGLRSMPVMFNIMEAFFNYRKPEVYFELIEDENYLVSYFDYIDFITSKDFSPNKELIEENLTSDIIYNFTVGKDLEDIKFKSEDGNEFIVAGISIIRRVHEVTVVVVTGKKENGKMPLKKEDFRFDTTNPNKTELFKDMEKDIKENELEYIYIDEEKKYIKVIVACRLDLDTMTIDARYVAEETNLIFQIKTDEIDGFIDANGNFNSQNNKAAFENSLKEIDNYNSIFETAKMSLYLPYYFNANEEFITEESVETPFKKENASPFNKRKFNDALGFKCSNKSVYAIDSKNILSPDTIKVRDDLFKIQTRGYWKKIPLEQIGLDKKGKPIHGKTWVTQNLSWFEAKEEELIVEKKTNQYSGPNSGFIYILRNPPMGDNIFKIGLTRNNVEDRVSQLSKTSVPDKFYKVQEWNVKDCITAEKLIHEKLDSYRIDPRREFFKIELENAIITIKKIIDELNGSIS